MAYPPIDERVAYGTAESIDKDRAYWFARGFMRGNPETAQMLVAAAAPSLPIRDDQDENDDLQADVLGLMFGTAFLSCEHGNIDLAFTQWVRAMLSS